MSDTTDTVFFKYHSNLAEMRVDQMVDQAGFPKEEWHIFIVRARKETAQRLAGEFRKLADMIDAHDFEYGGTKTGRETR